jgi:hypothetical protein
LREQSEIRILDFGFRSERTTKSAIADPKSGMGL